MLSRELLQVKAGIERSAKSSASKLHPVHIRRENLPEYGNGNDYVAADSKLIFETGGNFTSVSGVKTEKSVGGAFGGGGILGPNEYSIQLNTNDSSTTSACGHRSGCTVWQQFVYATDYAGLVRVGLFMQYWLSLWGSGMSVPLLAVWRRLLLQQQYY